MTQAPWVNSWERITVVSWVSVVGKNDLNSMSSVLGQNNLLSSLLVSIRNCLTLVKESTGAPRLNSSATTLTWPTLEAKWMAAKPFCQAYKLLSTQSSLCIQRVPITITYRLSITNQHTYNVLHSTLCFPNHRLFRSRTRAMISRSRWVRSGLLSLRGTWNENSMYSEWSWTRPSFVIHTVA